MTSDAPPIRVLVLDDARDEVDFVREALADQTLNDRPLAVDGFTAPQAFLDAIREEAPDVALVDLNLGPVSGLEITREALSMCPGLPVVMLTAYGTMASAVEALRAGAFDFLNKPLELDLLQLTVQRAARHAILKGQLRRLQELQRMPRSLPRIIGSSRAMRELADLVSRVAETDVTTLVTGESGTGKELVASAIHDGGERSERPFVPVNCAALPSQLLESELFGHERGAFTDARQRREGLFRRADGGTLFLDEVGEIELAMQVKLLRVLQERKVRPVGADREYDVDVRLVAATNKDLEEEVAAGRFREDLYYRLNVVRIELPPLRRRGRDVIELASHFVRQAAERFGKPVSGITDEVAERLLAYDFPGNVRELENAMERAVALTREPLLALADLPRRLRDHEPRGLAFDDPEELIPLAMVEERYIRHVLSACGNNKSQAARVLGLDRRTLYRKLERLDEDDASDGDQSVGSASAEAEP